MPFSFCTKETHTDWRECKVRARLRKRPARLSRIRVALTVKCLTLCSLEKSSQKYIADASFYWRANCIPWRVCISVIELQFSWHVWGFDSSVHRLRCWYKNVASTVKAIRSDFNRKDSSNSSYRSKHVFLIWSDIPWDIRQLMTDNQSLSDRLPSLTVSSVYASFSSRFLSCFSWRRWGYHRILRK